MSSAMEFAITTDLTPLKEFSISANFDECRAWLTENLEPYRGMVVTEDGIGAAGQYQGGCQPDRRVPEDGEGGGPCQLPAL